MSKEILSRNSRYTSSFLRNSVPKHSFLQPVHLHFSFPATKKQENQYFSNLASIPSAAPSFLQTYNMAKTFSRTCSCIFSSGPNIITIRKASLFRLGGKIQLHEAVFQPHNFCSDKMRAPTCSHDILGENKTALRKY